MVKIKAIEKEDLIPLCEKERALVGRGPSALRPASHRCCCFRFLFCSGARLNLVKFEAIEKDGLIPLWGAGRAVAVARDGASRAREGRGARAPAVCDGLEICMLPCPKRSALDDSRASFFCLPCGYLVRVRGLLVWDFSHGAWVKAKFVRFERSLVGLKDVCVSVRRSGMARGRGGLPLLNRSTA